MYPSVPPQKKSGLLAKLAAGFAVGTGIGFGTCGIGALIAKEKITTYFVSIGLFVFSVSLLGLIVVGIIGFVSVLLDRFRR